MDSVNPTPPPYPLCDLEQDISLLWAQFSPKRGWTWICILLPASVGLEEAAWHWGGRRGARVPLPVSSLGSVTNT